MVLVALIAIAVELALVATALWLWRGAETRRLVPIVGATAAGFLVAACAYFFVFQIGAECAGRGDFGCQVNSNQGVLTTLGLVLALGAVWTTVLIRFFDQRAKDRALSERVEMALLAAMEEVRHNLIHVAICYDRDGSFEKLPIVKVDETCKLLHDPVRPVLPERITDAAELIQRNFDALSRVEKNEGGFQEPEPYPIRGFVNHSLRFLIAAGEFSSRSHRILHEPGLQDLLKAATSRGSIYFCFRTSDKAFREELPRIRSEGTLVICWWNDRPPERTRVVAQGPRFDDLAEGHFD